MSTLFLLRGPSGVGKTTFVKNFQKFVDLVDIPIFHYEADQYFYGPDGVYRFNGKEIPHAHKRCMDNVIRQMKMGNNIVQSNTNIILAHLQPYIDLASENNYKVTVIRIGSDEYWKTYDKNRNIHNVPLNIIERQISQYQPYEGEITFHPDTQTFTYWS